MKKLGLLMMLLLLSRIALFCHGTDGGYRGEGSA